MTAALLLLAACAGTNAPRARQDAVLFRLIRPAYRGTVWVYEGDRERPNPEIPRVTLTAEDVAQLKALLGPPHLAEGKADFLSYSYILVLDETHRWDLHTVGFGTATLFEIREDGSTQYVFSRDGLRAWMAALEGIWSKRSAP